MVKQARKKSKKPLKSAEERKKELVQKAHRKLIRDALLSAGFQAASGIAGIEFNYLGVTSEFDDLFVIENVIVILEYTTAQESGISPHLKNKKILYDKILGDAPAFVTFLRSTFPKALDFLATSYQPHQTRVRIAYCSLNTVKSETKALCPGIHFYDYNVAKYFDAVTKTVRRSARYELLDFLDIESKDIGFAAINPAGGAVNAFSGSILPETHSNFGDGFKVVSFYIDPQSLLERAYVLRKYGWRAGDTVYQRMISRAKIDSIRRYLRDQKRVFINNIIATLPDDTKLIDEAGDTINPQNIRYTQPGRIQLPHRFNSIGIVDGQHRVFSYHEGGAFDDEIGKLRIQQNLLVTGIVFPRNLGEEERLKFEAKLFLEINSTQTNAKSDLKQEINLVINPFLPESIAKRVVNELNDSAGPLRDEFQRFFFEKDKIKTTSIVSFGIKLLVNPGNPKSLFSIWESEQKAEILAGSNASLLSDYVHFCAAEINHIFAGVRASIEKERWTADRKSDGYFLTTTNINGVISCLRRIAASGKLYTVDEYRERFASLSSFSFSSYRSSQYNALGEDMYVRYF